MVPMDTMERIYNIGSKIIVTICIIASITLNITYLCVADHNIWIKLLTFFIGIPLLSVIGIFVIVMVWMFICIIISTIIEAKKGNMSFDI